MTDRLDAAAERLRQAVREAIEGRRKEAASEAWRLEPDKVASKLHRTVSPEADLGLPWRLLAWAALHNPMPLIQALMELQGERMGPRRAERGRDDAEGAA